VANNLQLGNLCVVVDWNGSAAQLMPRDDLPEKWKAFGWNTMVIDGHSDTELHAAFSSVDFKSTGSPSVIIARTVKGKGVPLIEGHGPWHHRIPTEDEYKQIMEALS
jgi:transketolase